MKREEFWNRVYLMLKLLPEKEGDDGYEYLELGEIEELKNIRKNVNDNNKIEPGEAIRLEEICTKVRKKIIAERN